MASLGSFFYFLVALLLLVMVHEWGHFWVARRCGVKVLRFSFGFGKILARWRDRYGTEFVFSAFPLGGYVKMLDEDEGEVSESEKHLAFNRKSVWARIAIVLAGPVFNFIFAFLLLWLVLVIGTKSLIPVIKAVEPGSIAAKAGMKAGQEIVRLNDHNIKSWQDFQHALLMHIGDLKPMRLELTRPSGGDSTTIKLPALLKQPSLESTDILKEIGIVPFIPKVNPVVGSVQTDSPAEKAGILAGDRVIALDGKRLDDWLDLVRFVKSHPGKRITLTLMRDNHSEAVAFKIGSQEIQGNTVGYLGLMSQRTTWSTSKWLRTHRDGPIIALGKAFDQTAMLINTTFILIGKLITGKLSLQTISGPLGIAHGAGESARSGLVYYLLFLALISVNLGVLNLLPIPLLDGGHLFFYLIEVVSRRPVSNEMKSIGMSVGFVLLVLLMVVALGNDISRLVHT